MARTTKRNAKANAKAGPPSAEPLTDEELKSSNAQYRSSNAALQSANQELEASRKELRLLNEALNTVNQELAHRLDDLARANSNLNTLLEARQKVEAALKVSEQRFAVAQQFAGVGVWEWSPDTGESWWSPVAYELWGLPPRETPPPVETLPIHAEDRAAYEAILERDQASGSRDAEWRVVLPDGSIRWLAATGRRERPGGRMLGVVQDVTSRKQTEMRLTLLLGEVRHRVRNILSVVRSIIARSVRNSDNVEELAAHLDGRLDALGRTHGIFTRTAVDSIDLQDMIRDEMVAVAEREEQLTIEGPEIRLRREAAETVALALHELTTNAVKYGALCEPHGHLSVTWNRLRTSNGDRLSLEWKESGVRALDLRPSRSGFGRELIERGLPYELGAVTSLEFGRGGVRASIELPLTERIADLDADTEAADVKA